jgi:hypothetical protein
MKHSRVVVAFLMATLAGQAISEARSKNLNYDHQAIKAIIGENDKDGFAGMYAVACAIRNRGTLKGVHGRYKKLWNVPDGTIMKASRAWHTSEYGRDVTKGATHWENVKAFGKPKWAKDMVVTATIGRHVFYKTRRK